LRRVPQKKLKKSAASFRRLLGSADSIESTDKFNIESTDKFNIESTDKFNILLFRVRNFQPILFMLFICYKGLQMCYPPYFRVNFQTRNSWRFFYRIGLLVCALSLALQSCAALQSAFPALVETRPTSSPSTSVIPTNLPPGTQISLPMKVGYGMRGSFYELYFTDPFNPATVNEEGGPDVPLAAAINAARVSVDVAAYSISLYSIQQALINANKRGVRVRMVMESDNMSDPVPQALKATGIPIVGDNRPGLMHNKFMVIDHSEVWTGSMNYTISSTYEDNNNLIRIRSSKVATDYTTEFEEMFVDDFFGPDAITNTPYPQVTVDGTPLEVYFSPDDHVARRIAALLRAANSSIFFLAYSFTADDFGDIIRQKAQDGLKVAGVMDDSQIKLDTGTEYDPFITAGLPVFPDGNAGLMHHKVMIIDNEIVITGSYNFTASAERTNDENVLIIFDKQLAADYMAEFQRVFDEAPKIKGGTSMR
jgi:phosphatidylserine/phosphatidylglycerophosphate/cardiolipin synthase-like enzyme